MGPVKKNAAVQPLNRCRRARESAGLSVGQAARLLGVTADQLSRVEDSDAAYADFDPRRLADLYGVNLDWISGRCELRDHAALKQLPGADALPFCDRDVIAEMYASRPRGK